MSRNKTADARKALNRIAKMNKSRVPVDEMVDEMLLDEASVNEKNKEGAMYVYVLVTDIRLRY